MVVDVALKANWKKKNAGSILFPDKKKLATPRKLVVLSLEDPVVVTVLYPVLP
jgi:hypothetical protein